MRMLLSVLALIAAPMTASGEAGSVLDFSGCEHFLTAQNLDCSVEHIFRCEGRGAIVGGAKLYANGNEIYSHLADEKGFALEENIIFPDGNFYLKEMVQLRKVDVKVGSELEYSDEFEQVYTSPNGDYLGVVVVDNGTYKRLGKTSQAFGMEVVEYHFKMRREHRANDEVFYWYENEATGLFAVKEKLHFSIKNKMHYSTGEVEKGDATTVKLLKPEDPGFESKEPLLACNGTS